MKTLLLPMLLLIGCVPYTKFVSVESPLAPIPKGTTEFAFTGTLDQVGDILTQNQVMFTRSDNGISTEEFLLDAATRAQYRFYELNGQIKCVPYWGVTAAVQQQMALMAGMAAAQGSDGMQRVVYDKSQTRPKMVFDYAVQLFSPSAQLTYK